MEVFHQRLDQEYGASIITTTPTVPYSLKHTDGSTEEIQNPSQVQLVLAMRYLQDEATLVIMSPAPLQPCEAVQLCSALLSLAMSLLVRQDPPFQADCMLLLQFPLGKKLAGIFEPTVAATIITPTAHVGAIMQLAQDRRGDMTEHTLLGPERTLLRCNILLQTFAKHILRKQLALSHAFRATTLPFPSC